MQQRQEKADEFNRIYTQVGTAQKNAAQIAAWMNDRYYWGDLLAELRRVLIRSEEGVQKKLSAQRTGVQAGIWIEQMTTMNSMGSALNAAGGPPRYNNGMPGNEAQTQTNQTGAMTLICRAVSLSKVDPAANSSIAYTLENELQASPYFDPKATQLTGQINAEDASGTFTFGISAVLKNPLNL